MTLLQRVLHRKLHHCFLNRLHLQERFCWLLLAATVMLTRRHLRLLYEALPSAFLGAGAHTRLAGLLHQ
jgi:hypothetical protein